MKKAFGKRGNLRVISIETIADKFAKFPSWLGFLAARVNLEQGRTKDEREIRKMRGSG